MGARLRVTAIVLLAAVLTACQMSHSPSAPSGDWATYDSPRFTLYARPGSFAEGSAASLAEVLEEQYTYASSLFGLPEGRRVSVFLYNHGSEITPPLPEARAGVAFPETSALHVVAFAPFDDNLRSLLAHEANHIILNGGMGRPGTSFVNEGLASAVISERYAEVGRTFYARWAKANRARLVPLADLIDDDKWDSNSNNGYNTSAAFLAYLIDQYGIAKLKQVYYASSADFARRAAEVYGKPLETLQAEWLAAF